MGLTEDQQKGLDMMVKILSKEYPYIIGASPNIGDFEEYSTLFTIKLIMSKLKLEKCFKQKVDNNWNEFWRLGNLFYPNPDPEDLLVEEIRSLGKMFYDVITDEYQFNSTLTKGEFRQVKINSFILDDKN
jgi:hypothetical protein